MGDRICSFPECGKRARSKGHCQAHADQRRKGQELRPLRPYPERMPRQPGQLCAVDCCGRFAEKRGMCATHYCASRRGFALSHLDRPLHEWFFSRVVQGDGGCWLWSNATNTYGYGTFRLPGGKSALAHRWSYEFMVADIPAGLTIDHLCRVRACVNPFHMEPVPAGINTLRGNAVSAINARKTHCIRGHEFTDANTIRRSSGGRRCRECTAIYNAEAWKRHSIAR